MGSRTNLQVFRHLECTGNNQQINDKKYRQLMVSFLDIKVDLKENKQKTIRNMKK